MSTYHLGAGRPLVKWLEISNGGFHPKQLAGHGFLKAKLPSQFEINSSGTKKRPHGEALGQFDWVGVGVGDGGWGGGVRDYFSTRTVIDSAAVSYRSKKVRSVASPAVRSVNKSRDTRNRVQNEPEYAICVMFTTRLY